MESKTGQLLRTVTMFAYISGLPYFWFEHLKWPQYLKTIIVSLAQALTVLFCIFMIMEILGVFTQTSLTEQQKSDAIKYSFSQPILFMNFFKLSYHKEDIKKLIKKLLTDLPTYHNDEEVERQLVKKAKLYLMASLGSIVFTLITVGLDSLMRVLLEDNVFTTVITTWPDVEDKSLAASVGRVIVYVVWWLWVLRLCGSMSIVITLTICTSHQYKQLQSYFCSLKNIFERNCSQLAKEEEYEKALVLGFKLHNNVLSYTQELGRICSVAYGGLIIVNVSVMAIVLIQVTNEDRTILMVLSWIMLSIALLGSCGFYMWTLGDITVEASQICTSMYMSGWENCTGQSSVRVRKMMVTAMTRAQKEVVITTLMILKVSYGSYLSIVKFTYSIFSVMY
nr:odorant receptor 25 [Achelura yunnanensis]